MARPKTPHPTDAELAILRILWRRGRATVRTVFDELAPRGDCGYTTVLKLLQIMLEKGLVRRDTTNRSHVYAPAVRQEDTQRRLVRRLLDCAFDGSAARLAMGALAARPASPAELAEIRRFLDEQEKGAGQ